MRVELFRWLRFLAWVAIGVSCCGPHSLAGEEHDRAKLTTSPDGKIAIRSNDKIGSMEFDFDFYEISSGKSLGHIKAADFVSKVDFVCRWSPKGTHVAVLMFYGTKHSKLLIFERRNDGQMSEIPLSMPDPDQEYAKAKLKPDLGENHGGASLNGLGEWKGEDSIELLCGYWLDRVGEVDVDPAGQNLMVLFDAEIVEKKTVVGNIRRLGLMSDDATELLLKKRRIITGDDGS